MDPVKSLVSDAQQKASIFFYLHNVTMKMRQIIYIYSINIYGHNFVNLCTVLCGRTKYMWQKTEIMTIA